MDASAVVPTDPVALAVAEVVTQAGKGMATASAMAAVASISRRWVMEAEGIEARQSARDMLQELASQLRDKSQEHRYEPEGVALAAAAQVAGLAALGEG